MAVRADVAGTFSIAAFDPGSGDVGVAVQSRFFAVGAVVPWARAGVGAVATQAGTNTGFGPRGLELMAAGHTAASALRALLAEDGAVGVRQVGLVDAAGTAAAHTGVDCLPWAGQRTGRNFAAQGNILAGPRVVDAMADAFGASQGDLADRLLAGLRAGQAAGGDRRGMQSAAMLVARANAGFNGWTDRFVDLRVDDHPAPIEELGRLVDLQRAFHLRQRPTGPVRLDEESLPPIRRALRHTGHLGAATGPEPAALDPLTRAALRAFAAERGLAGEAAGDLLPADVYVSLLAVTSGRRPAS